MENNSKCPVTGKTAKSIAGSDTSNRGWCQFAVGQKNTDFVDSCHVRKKYYDRVQRIICRQQELMLRQLIFTIITLFLISGTTVIAGEIDTKIAIKNLLEKKCSQCHKVDRVTKMHASKESFVDIIMKMIKKGANVSQKESEDIADFLGNPTRFVLNEQCTKCHGLDRIIKAHEKGTLTKDTLKTMQKKGAKINDKEVEALWEFLGSTYYTSSSPSASPGTR